MNSRDLQRQVLVVIGALVALVGSFIGSGATAGSPLRPPSSGGSAGSPWHGSAEPCSP
ncbi:hypothetical protein [Cryobacterium sp. GrIS_2_6]|uniref:hypothetical protein n=1 Tax=Cryobacterium sp. GrIS_2_6 TaxID=3162785 RepID=UPI002DF7B3AF|nr:hypothetical protein [Cryobacterium psychrotolerans]